MFSSLLRRHSSHKHLDSRSRQLRGFRSRFEQLEPRAMMAVDSILHWNAIALQAEANDKSNIYGSADAPGPTGASRALAIVSVAMFDAINSIEGKYEPYLIKVVGVKGANIDAAVGQAAHDTLVSVYHKQAAAFDAALNDWLTTIPNGKAENMGIALGKIVAKAILKARKNDGSDVMEPFNFVNGPGKYQVDPLHPNQMPLGPDWGKVTPFGIKNVAKFNIAPPPALNSQAYTDAYNEVRNLGGDGVNTPTQRTAAETEIGLFWAYDGTKGLGTPPRFYNQIATVIAQQQGNTEYQNARMFALINVAIADAGIACWADKYEYDFWRPITGIRAGATDGNSNTVGDANWTPLGAPASNQSGTNFTPPFPSYASGHATFGGALFQTLTRFYGTDHMTFTITSDEENGVTTDENGVVRPLAPRTFTSFSQAAEENGQSRIYLGIHWSFDKVSGIKQGDAIANYIFNHILEPLHAGMPAGSNQNMLMSYVHTLVDCKLMDIRDGVHRQVVMMQTIVQPQTTTFKFSSLAPPANLGLIRFSNHANPSAPSSQIVDDLLAGFNV
jgi:hypothetical protein